MATVNKQACPTCGQSVNTREIGLYRGMVDALLEVFKWCETKGKHEFQRKEIKHLLKDDGQIARFGDWVMFGGLVYKEGKGHYGLNMERCRNFFAGKYDIPSAVFKDPLTGEITPGEKKPINKIPKLTAFLNDNQEFIATYVNEAQASNTPAWNCKTCLRMNQFNNWTAHVHVKESK